MAGVIANHVHVHLGHLHDIIISYVEAINLSTSFCNFLPFCQSTIEKEKQQRMNELTIAQWINLNQNNRPLVVS